MWAKASSIFSSCKFVLEHTLKPGMGHLLVELLFQRLLHCGRPLCFQHKGKGPVYKRPSGIARLLCSRAQEKEGRDQHKSTSSCMLTHHRCRRSKKWKSYSASISYRFMNSNLKRKRDYFCVAAAPKKRNEMKIARIFSFSKSLSSCSSPAHRPHQP